MPHWLSELLPSWAEPVVSPLFDPRVLSVLGALSVLLFVVSVVALPWLVARLPSDYFAPRSLAVRRRALQLRHPLYAIVRNLFGLLLVVCGLLMLFLPGQGLLTIIVGLVLAEFPGKDRVERAIVSAPPVLRALNAIRRRAKRPPLDLGESND
ncbi:MAG TPA: PGPGW domain-containing protein [Polyangiaceae bacterium]